MASRTDGQEDAGEPDRVAGCRHPRDTVTLHGHGAAEALLAAALTKGTLAHGWLIGGPAGIGKATLAYRLAKAVLVPDARLSSDSLETDHQHAGIRRILSGGHGDLVVIRRPVDENTGKAKATIPVEAVRRLQAFFGHHAGEGGWRVAVIDNANDLTTSAANALLKTLEEPPPRALILLVADAPARLLPTIRSRCRRLILKPLGTDDLSRVLKEQDIAVPQDKAGLVARLSQGSAGRAAGLVQGDGLALFEDLSGLLETLPQLDVSKLHIFAERVTRRGNDAAFETVRDLLEGWMMRLVRTAATGAPGEDLLPGDGERIAALAGRRPLDAWLEAWDKIAEALAAGVGLNLERKQLLLSAFFTLQAAAKGA
ncbi:MAG: DNA polymerase III subunit delta' [Alphaproteobacteria bacterium]